MAKRVLIVNANAAVAFGLCCLARRAGLEVAHVVSDAADARGPAAAADIVLIDAALAQTPEGRALLESADARARRFLVTSGRAGEPPAGGAFPFECAPLSDEPILDLLDKAKAAVLGPPLPLRPAA